MNVSEAEFLRVVQHVGRLLAKKFRFPGCVDEDVRQLVAVWAWEALPRFDPSAGNLDSYLYTHCRNRCINKTRDEVGRADYPCPRCHSGEPCDDGRVCPRYKKWSERNQSKAQIARPLGFESVMGLTTESSVEPDAIGRDLTARIDAQLPIELRPFYLQMLAGVSVSPDRRRRVQGAVADILGEPGLAQDGSACED